mgnify:CR=1 FL=1
MLPICRMISMRKSTRPNMAFSDRYARSGLHIKSMPLKITIVASNSESGVCCSRFLKMEGVNRSSATELTVSKNAGIMHMNTTLGRILKARHTMKPVFCHRLYLGFFVLVSVICYLRIDCYVSGLCICCF